MDWKQEQKQADARREAETKRLFKALRHEAETGNHLAVEAIRFLEVVLYGKEGVSNEV